MKDNLNKIFNDRSKADIAVFDNPLFSRKYYSQWQAPFTDLEGQLLKAAENGDTAKVADLIKKDANVFVGNEKPLLLAAGNGHLEVVKLLLNTEGAWGHYYATIYKGHAAEKAAENGHQEVATYLKQTLKNHTAFLDYQWNNIGKPNSPKPPKAA
jgi:hypothetical protein